MVIETNVGPLLTRFNANIRLTVRSKATMARILEFLFSRQLNTNTVFKDAFFFFYQIMFNKLIDFHFNTQTESVSFQRLKYSN